MSGDLISREAAMIAIHNAQTAVGWSNGMHEMDIHKALMNVPAVDAVPVVRCRECINRKTDDCPMYFSFCDANGETCEDRSLDDGYCDEGTKIDGEDADG